MRTGLTFKKDQRTIANELGIPYLIAKHNSEEVLSRLSELKPELGLVAGARILREAVIRKFSKGVRNAHPGLIPQTEAYTPFITEYCEDCPRLQPFISLTNELMRAK